MPSISGKAAKMNVYLIEKHPTGKVVTCKHLPLPLEHPQKLSTALSSAASKYICGAKLIALNKNSDTFCPIAVGEVNFSKVACSSVLSDARKLLVPHQVGVGVPAAC